MKYYYYLLLLLCFSSKTNAVFSQPQQDVKFQEELKVGDQVPDLIFNNIVNHSTTTTRLSDYRGKLVILDFWATWCASCLWVMPKLDSLQQKFKDKIVILPITYENTVQVADFLKSNKYLKNVKLPFVTNSNFKGYFPYKVLSHLVWIDPDSKVLATTASEEVTEENIIKFLEKSVPEKLKQKVDIVDGDELQPFLAGRFGSHKFSAKDIKYSTTITKGIEGASGSFWFSPYINKADSLVMISNTNAYVQYLYKSALVNPDFSEDNVFKNLDNLLLQNARTIWEAKDSTYFIGSETIARMDKLPNDKKAFNYQIILPLKDSLNIKEYMLQDLNRYFRSSLGIEGLREKRKVKCWALTIIGSENLFKTKGGTPIFDYAGRVKNGFNAQNVNIDRLLFEWVTFNLPAMYPIPIINETGYTKPVDINLGQEIDPKDFNSVNKALKSHGLEFKLVERDLDMIVIRDVKK